MTKLIDHSVIDPGGDYTYTYTETVTTSDDVVATLSFDPPTVSTSSDRGCSNV